MEQATAMTTVVSNVKQQPTSGDSKYAISITNTAAQSSRSDSGLKK